MKIKVYKCPKCKRIQGFIGKNPRCGNCNSPMTEDDFSHKTELKINWRKYMEFGFQERGTPFIVIGRLFNRLLLLDYSKKQCWWVPRFENISDNLWRAGWLYWAIGGTKKPFDPIRWMKLQLRMDA